MQIKIPESTGLLFLALFLLFFFRYLNCNTRRREEAISCSLLRTGYTMTMRWGFFFLALLTASSSSADARNIANIDVSATKVTLWHDNRDKVSSAEPLGRNIELCILCTSFTAQATQYLSENKSQTEIIENLHQSCSELMPFQEQCNLLVDYYAPLFFIEIANIDPNEFCTKVNLCEESGMHLQKSSMLLQNNNQSCSICHDAIDEILNKMSDPDTEIKIIELLLKECSKVQHHVQQCKRLVITYAPLILINGEKFLRKTDICAEIHACEPRVLVTTPLSTIASV